MKIDTPCPMCSETPVDVLDLRDGEVWICSGCGYQETGVGVDIEAQLLALTEYDAKLAASWRDALGL